MNENVSYKSIILTSFVFPFAITMGMLYGIAYLINYLFPSSLGMNILMPLWFMVYARTFAANTYKRLPPLNQNHLNIIKGVSAIFMIAWFYFALRPQYSPIMSLVWACFLLGLPTAGQYLGASFDAWRKRRA